jgi:hypothetical protein
VSTCSVAVLGARPGCHPTSDCVPTTDRSAKRSASWVPGSAV